MLPRALVEKVVCYVVRDDRLLVFRHADLPYEETGLQVPAGTVRPGEAPVVAALREAGEETGLVGLRVVRPLGVTIYDAAPMRPERHRRHVFHLAVDGPVPQRWTSWERHDGHAPPTRFTCFWIPLAAGHVLSGGQGALLGRLADALADQER
ncbi:NUDIX hydrolase [Pseudonocardia sp.]|uniref:NUDIX hydrolase n=1 Tax=Pseudonocardia sp. TaxID=60912 RepID=UPI003D12DD6B